LLLDISRSHDIARRYFVVNGFDGALTMLGINIAFLASGKVDLPVVIHACLGAAVALAVSGLSSAYVSETAERRRELRELEQAMATNLGDSAPGQAARWMPVLIAVINGSAPLIISLFIITPLWMAQAGITLPADPLLTAIAVTFVVIFLLGVFLGRISGTFWLWSGVRTLLIAGITGVLIILVTH
jgi:predicted membrane protein (TIGR00267 family)